MAKLRSDTITLDLLEWKPETPIVAFNEREVRAVSLNAQIAKAISLTLKESKLTREELGALMAAFLGQPDPISENMLNAYASEARGDHNISYERLIALVHATGDSRLLSIALDQFGLALVEKRYLPAIEEAQVAEKIEELTRLKNQKRTAWKGVR